MAAISGYNFPMHPDPARAGAVDPAWHRLGVIWAMVAALTGCAAGTQPVDDQAASAQAVSALPQQPAATQPATQPTPTPAPQRDREPADPVQTVLGYIDRIRDLAPAELAQESRRLSDAGDSAIRLMQLAAALAQSKVPANTLRAQALLQRVLGQNDEETMPLRSLARLLSAQVAESRRADEQIERQAQQLRDAQKRIDQLNERLEAVRTIERSLRSPAAAGAPGSPASTPARHR